MVRIMLHDWASIFSIRITHVYFVYGLAFFVLGLAVALEVGRAENTRFSQAMRPLAVFGLTHGFNEWVDMFALVGRQTYHFQPNVIFSILRLALLSVSFASLAAFGVQMLNPVQRIKNPDLWNGLMMLFGYGLVVIAAGAWLKWEQSNWFTVADVLARYLLGIPSTIVTAWALLVERQIFLRNRQTDFANDLLWASIAFVLYGVVGQFFVTATPLFPSTIINADTFQAALGIPIQLFRTIMAVTIAIFMVRALRSFEYNRRQELAEAHQRAETERHQRYILRKQFLQRVVEAQEEERARIARELHDELGQALTGLSIGLRGLQTSTANQAVLRQQLKQLEEITVNTLGNMRHLVTELRPALLDDMGLSAALQNYTQNYAKLTGLDIALSISPEEMYLRPNTEIVLFRITQEALTNVIRHAEATQAHINLECTPHQITLKIADNGHGLNGAESEDNWGLFGIKERVKLVEGQLKINSNPGKGTVLLIQIPFENRNTPNVSPHQINTG